MKANSFIILTFILIIISGCNKNDRLDDEDNQPQSGNGVYAVYSNGGQWANRKAYLWKDEVQTNLSNQSQQSNLYVTAVAVSSTGDVYVAGGEGLTVRQDLPGASEFVDNVNTVLWKNGVKQNLNSSPVPRWFMKGKDVDLAINSNNDVFVLGRDGATNAGDYSIWKNGTRIIELSDNINLNIYPSKIAAKDNDVYVCGHTEGSSTPRKAALWKNGVLQNLNTTALYANCVSVSDNNDVYVGLADGTYLKNNTTQAPLFSAAGNDANRIYDIVCVGTDVYTLGYTSGNETVIWKNGTPLYNLTTATTSYLNVYSQSLFISGNDVFTSGVLSGGGSSTAAVIFKNGTLYKTMYEGNGILVDAPSVFVK